MPDTVIVQVTIFGIYQKYLLVFKYYKVCLIGDGDIKLTGLEWDEHENESPIRNNH